MQANADANDTIDPAPPGRIKMPEHVQRKRMFVQDTPVNKH